MTIKYNVTGAKTRCGKEILPMAFGDRAEAERFAKYYEGLSIPQNLRKHPGNISVTGTYSSKGNPQNIPRVLAESLSLHAQLVGRAERKSPSVTIVVDPKVFMAGIEEHVGPVQILKLPKEIVCELTNPLDNESDADKYAACEDAIKMNDNMRKYGTIDVPRSATVGNADLESAYEMGFLAATQRFTPFTAVDYTETQDYVDQRRSDLKELISYDRKV